MSDQASFRGMTPEEQAASDRAESRRVDAQESFERWLENGAQTAAAPRTEEREG